MATAATEQRTIIEKGPRRGTPERIEVRATVYQGHDVVHARIHYLSEEGEWRPSPRGFSLAPEIALEVGAAMVAAARQQLGE